MLLPFRRHRQLGLTIVKLMFPVDVVDILICISESVLQHSSDTCIAPVGQLWATCTGLGLVVHGRDSDLNCSKNVPSSLVLVNSIQLQPCQGFSLACALLGSLRFVGNIESHRSAPYVSRNSE